MSERPITPRRLRRLRKLGRSQSGLALTEFAFALPIFLVLLFGGLEVANFALTHLRVNQISMAVADNAGRVRTGIDESHIYEVFAGADQTGQTIAFRDNGRIVLSSLEPNRRPNPQTGQMINWQRCHGALQVAPAYGVQDAGRMNASLAEGLGPEGNRIVAADGTAVMFVEVTYRYRPVILPLIGSERTIRYESAFNVRERTNQDISNVQGLARNLCT